MAGFQNGVMGCKQLPDSDQGNYKLHEVLIELQAGPKYTNALLKATFDGRAVDAVYPNVNYHPGTFQCFGEFFSCVYVSLFIPKQ